MKPSLLSRYETLRRKESERLTALVDTLGQIDGLPAEQMDQARDALFHTDNPYLVVLVGAFNTGKSSIINALIGEPVLEVGATPTTSKIAILRYGPTAQRMQAGEVETVFHPAPLLEQLSLVDTPGLESIFKAHDEVTRRFLHRSDLVLFVMPATQAMSANNVQYMQSLRAYGKRVIVVINQVDTLEGEERQTLRDFVAEQSKASLGFAPQVWMLSARLALEAKQSTPRDEIKWQESGFAEVENYLNDALSDAARVRQKLETPLQIARNVTTIARARVREQQNALADYHRSAENVHRQIDAATRDQRGTVRENVEEVSRVFAEAIRRGREAIQDIFQFSRVLSMALSALIELLGVAGLLRRLGGSTAAKGAFEARKVNEPLDSLPTVLDKLGPRLEGRDVKDIDDLIAYTRREVERLPGELQTKLVGKLEAPTTYDRAFLQNARDGYLRILDRARSVEFQRIDRAVHNWLIVMGGYQLILILAAVVGALALSGSQNGNWLLLIVVVIVLGVAGIALLPLRGRLMEQAYARRMLGIESELEQAITRAAEEQIGVGARMRGDAVGPFMRLVEAQVSQVDELKSDLENLEQGLLGLEKDLGGLKE